MSTVTILPGESFDVVSHSELRHEIQALERRMDGYIRDVYRGVKPIRMRPIINMPANTTGFIDAGGPRSGFYWTISLISYVVSAITGSSQNAYLYRTTDWSNATPFLAAGSNSIGLGYIGTAASKGAPQTFGNGGILLHPDEHLVAYCPQQSTQQQAELIIDAIEVPAEMVGKILI